MKGTPKKNWDDLRSVDPSGPSQPDGLSGVISKDTGIDTGYGPAYVALGPAGQPRLLVAVSSPHDALGIEATGKIAIEPIPYQQQDGSRLNFIDITCNEHSLDAVFGELVQQVLERLSNGEPPTRAVNGTLEEFKDLLLNEADGAPTQNKVIGLLGELYILKEMSHIDPGCIDSWKGPWEQRHDFRRSHNAIEVKTSSRSDQTMVSIHGIEQLLPPKNGGLALVQVCMEPSSNGSCHVSALFDELIRAGVNRMTLKKGLGQIGCLDPHDPQWNQHRFELQGSSSWRIGTGFPRITTEELKPHAPSGISNVEYRLDLSTVPKKYSMSRNQFSRHLAAFLQ